jgi:hypothetical protein
MLGADISECRRVHNDSNRSADDITAAVVAYESRASDGDPASGLHLMKKDVFPSVL